MGKDKINRFEKAIKDGELLDFAIGNGEYFVTDRDYGEHSIIGSWINYILPLLKIKHVDFINTSIVDMFSSLIYENELNDQTKIEALLGHLFTYYYLLNENRIPRFELIQLEPDIESIFLNYTDKLKENNDQKLYAFLNAIEIIKSRGGLLI